MYAVILQGLRLTHPPETTFSPSSWDQPHLGPVFIKDARSFLRVLLREEVDLFVSLSVPYFRGPCGLPDTGRVISGFVVI